MENKKTNQTIEIRMPTDRPSRCETIFATTSLFEAVTREAVIAQGEKIAQEFEECMRDIEGIGRKRFVIMKNKPLCFDRDTALLIWNSSEIELPVVDTMEPPADTEFKLKKTGELKYHIMTKSECNRLFEQAAENPLLIRRKLKNMEGKTSIRYILTEETKREYGDTKSNVYDISEETHSYWCNRSDVNIVPVFRLKEKNNKKVMSYVTSFLQWMQLELIPSGLSDAQEEQYRRLQKAYKQIADYLSIDSNDHITIDVEQFQAAVDTGILKDKILGYEFDVRKAIETAKSKNICNKSGIDAIKTDLLNCDNTRADLAPYDEGLLTDLNRGHWELFEYSTNPPSDSVEVNIDIDLVARPPQLDVSNGICAIDFGTKSTVVVCRDRETKMLRIGKGDYRKEAVKDDYENPTVIHLRDMEAFLKAYRARTGRPFTEWNQATVSHQAADKLKSANESSVYLSVFNELKQWAKENDGWSVLCDEKGAKYDVKPYLETGAMDNEQGGGEFDPIELYAYYLGLYINNMHRCIYLDYILSYPVNYSKAVRERIRQSFERGIKKSLPPSILSNEELMKKRFRVYLGASEPAAYAICALEQFELQPTQTFDPEAPESSKNKVAYGVFDFGGGTTDFDFGVEYKPVDASRHFIIEQFGFNGDIHLGGENILELLAYEVYKDNLKEMRENNIPFALPAEGEEFAGAELLVSRAKDSVAHMNTRILAEKLRPIWENSEGKETLDKDVLKIALFSRNSTAPINEANSNKVDVNLKIKTEELEKLIKNRIQRGVDSFFQSLHNAFKKRNDYNGTIHIFLAGNSCRSKIVEDLFKKCIADEEKKLQESATQSSGEEKSAKGAYKLHLPIDMQPDKKAQDSTAVKEAEKEQPKENDMSEQPQNAVDMSFDRRRTGKTGVAFGLLRCRKGGKDVKIINLNEDAEGEMLFPYYLGMESADQEFVVSIGEEVGYGDWAFFVKADEDEFELYYTSDPIAKKGGLPIEKAEAVRCFLKSEEIAKNDAKDYGVYIRKKDPHTIEYAVGTKADMENIDEIRVHSQEL